ncbi:MAG: hypothetical protein MH204_04780 [Fimbriimonadaceae bacterium]|nr:hypothetical protein [Fimbriimonadaceae bacterium]
MKPRLLLPVALLAAAGVLVAQNPATQQFRDKGGNLRIWNLTGHEVTFTPDGPLNFNGVGSPLFGESKSQGVTLQGRSLKALLKPAAQNSYELQSVDLAGDVRLRQTFPQGVRTLETGSLKMESRLGETFVTLPGRSTLVQEGQGRRLELKSGSGGLSMPPELRSSEGRFLGTFQGGVEATATEPGARRTASSQSMTVGVEGGQTSVAFERAFVLESDETSAGASRSIRLAGQSGTFQFLGGGRGNGNPLRQSEGDRQGGLNPFGATEIKGPVDIRIVDRRGEEVRTVQAKAASIVYRPADLTLTLSGGVEYDVSIQTPGRPDIGGEGQSERLIITFTPEGRIKEYRAVAGSAELKEAPKAP